MLDIVEHVLAEGREVPLAYEDGECTGKSCTQQWTIWHKAGRPAIVGLIYDQFDVERGAEYEFVQVTVPADQLISAITDCMPLLLIGMTTLRCGSANGVNRSKK